MEPTLPTVGRIVHFWPKEYPEGHPHGGQPYAAIVCFVWPKDHTSVDFADPRHHTMVNLSIFNQDGDSYKRIGVPFVQDGVEAPANNNGYCSWPKKV